MRRSIGEIDSLCRAALRASGLFDASAAATARTIAAAERDGCQSHGLFRLAGYCNALRSGKASATARPVVHEGAPSAVRVDAQRGLAPHALEVGLPELAARAKRQGVAVLSLSNVFHFSALWHEVEWLADRGLVALAFLNTKAFVTHFGSRDGGPDSLIYGTNPMAFGFPRSAPELPLIFDQASAMMARGEISLAEQRGERLPDGCAIDRDGRPTDEPAAALGGAQLPFGRHKGACVAMMVELLVAGMSGGPFSFDVRAQDVDESSA